MKPSENLAWGIRTSSAMTFTNILKGKGYGDDQLRETAVCLMWMSGMECMTNSGTGLCFPIMDVNNRVIGFGGTCHGRWKAQVPEFPGDKDF